MEAEPEEATTKVISKGSLSISLSFEITLKLVFIESSLTVAVSGLATGTSFTEMIVINTLPLSVPPLPSEIVYVNVSLPNRLAVGVNTRIPEVLVYVPSVDGDTFVRGSTLFSISVSSDSRLTEAELSSFMLNVLSFATGASFTAVTVTDTVAVDDN